jgi:hypothetical protein
VFVVACSEEELSRNLAKAEARLKDKEDVCQVLQTKLKLAEAKNSEADNLAKKLTLKLQTAEEVKIIGLGEKEVQISSKDKELALFSKEFNIMKSLLGASQNEIKKLRSFMLLEGGRKTEEVKLEELRADNKKLIDWSTAIQMQMKMKMEELER